MSLRVYRLLEIQPGFLLLVDPLLLTEPAFVDNTKWNCNNNHHYNTNCQTNSKPNQTSLGTKLRTLINLPKQKENYLSAL